MKHCRKCEVPLVAGENWTASASNKNDHICRKCVRDKNRKYRKANVEKIRARQASYRAENKGIIDARIAKWRLENPDKVRAGLAKYQKDNLPKFRASKAKRRALKKAQTPSWYCHETVTAIYEGCPDGWHVDHIVPLAKGGLHSHENLQYLPAAENLSKGDSDCWLSWSA